MPSKKLPDWWVQLSPESKAKYLDKHPNSKLGQQEAKSIKMDKKAKAEVKALKGDLKKGGGKVAKAVEDALGDTQKAVDKAFPKPEQKKEAASALRTAAKKMGGKAAKIAARAVTSRLLRRSGLLFLGAGAGILLGAPIDILTPTLVGEIWNRMDFADAKSDDDVLKKAVETVSKRFEEGFSDEEIEKSMVPSKGKGRAEEVSHLRMYDTEETLRRDVRNLERRMQEVSLVSATSAEDQYDLLKFYTKARDYAGNCLLQAETLNGTISSLAKRVYDKASDFQSFHRGVVNEYALMVKDQIADFINEEEVISYVKLPLQGVDYTLTQNNSVAATVVLSFEVQKGSLYVLVRRDGFGDVEVTASNSKTVLDRATWHQATDDLKAGLKLALSPYFQEA